MNAHHLCSVSLFTSFKVEAHLLSHNSGNKGANSYLIWVGLILDFLFLNSFSFNLFLVFGRGFKNQTQGNYEKDISNQLSIIFFLSNTSPFKNYKTIKCKFIKMKYFTILIKIK